MAERYEHLEKAMCKELEKLDKKYTADVEMTEQDAERARKLYHALKSAETYHAMKDAEELEDEEGEESSILHASLIFSLGKSVHSGIFIEFFNILIAFFPAASSALYISSSIPSDGGLV